MDILYVVYISMAVYYIWYTLPCLYVAYVLGYMYNIKCKRMIVYMNTGRMHNVYKN